MLESRQGYALEERARPGSLRAGGDLLLSAGKDLTLLGVAGQGRNLGFWAGGDLSILALTQTQARGEGHVTQLVGNGAVVLREQGWSQESTQVIGSAFTGGSLELRSGEDMRIAGSRIVVAGAGRIEAGGSLAIGAVQEVELERSASRTLWQESARMESATRNIVSDIVVGGNLGIAAGGDMTLDGGRLEAGKALVLEAGGDVNLLARQDFRIWSGAGGEEGSSAVVESWLRSGGELSVRSGGDVLVAGANLDAGRDLEVAAGGDLTNLGGSFTGDDLRLRAKGSVFDVNGKAEGRGDVRVGAGKNLALHTEGEGERLRYRA
ncbi:MAG: hemagglutinin repeat-containing protein, partial [Zoogloeaceae bacterium]|nr:hemagglutinin repeat-containing protein [Zoogloeaceae bacterium]